MQESLGILFVLMVFFHFILQVFFWIFSFIAVFLFVFFPNTEGPTWAAFKSNTSGLESRIKQDATSEVFIYLFFKVKLAVQK